MGFLLLVVGGGWGGGSEHQKLTAADAAPADVFGFAVSLSGDTAIVGAIRGDDNGTDSGAAYVFTRTNGVWVEEQKLIPSDGEADDFFGWSVSVSGDTALVGTLQDDDNAAQSGSAYVFTRTDGVWVEEQKLTASDSEAGDFFGSSVSVFGDTALVAAHHEDGGGTNSGAAYVFVRTAGVWIEEQKLAADDAAPGDFFGSAVSLYEDTALIGAYRDDASAADGGAAYVFTRDGSVWTQQQELVASDPGPNELFGLSVSLSGDTALVGAFLHEHTDTAAGAAYVFTRTAGVWTEEQELSASDAAEDDAFGISVSVSDDTAVVGAYRTDDGEADSGSAYVFTRMSGAWTEQQTLTASEPGTEDQFGSTVSASGVTALVGAYADDDEGEASGSAYIFAPTCGNGAIDIGEDCDDAGESATCDADCSDVSCGDGTANVAAGEDCDDAGESAACDDDCTGATCGDGTLNVGAGEDCDDGNNDDGDGCASDCVDEVGGSTSAAGESSSSESTADSGTAETAGDDDLTGQDTGSTNAGEDEGATPDGCSCSSTSRRANAIWAWGLLALAFTRRSGGLPASGLDSEGD